MICCWLKTSEKSVPKFLKNIIVLAVGTVYATALLISFRQHMDMWKRVIYTGIIFCCFLALFSLNNSQDHAGARDKHEHFRYVF
jgi:hypothetical protein